MLSAIHPLRSEAVVPGLFSLSAPPPSLSDLSQELQSMNIAARLYTVSTGRIRDSS
jgi:hypothetical protein